MKFSSLILITVLVFPGLIHGKAKPWTLLENRRGISVFFRTYEENDFLEFKAEGSTDASFQAGLEVINDFDSYFKWFGLCKKMYVISKEDENNNRMYFEMDIPVLPNLDVVVNVKSKWNKEEGIGIVEFESVESEYNKGFYRYRIPYLKGCCILKRLSENRIKATYQVLNYFPGIIKILPKSYLKKITRQHTYNTGSGLIEEVVKISNKIKK